MAESTGNGLSEFSPEQLRQHGPTIDAACRNAGMAKGDSMIVMWDNQVYYYRYEGDADRVEGMPIPNCPVDLCRSIQPQIDRMCQTKGWPPDQPVLVMQPDGSICYCYCC